MISYCSGVIRTNGRDHRVADTLLADVVSAERIVAIFMSDQPVRAPGNAFRTFGEEQLIEQDEVALAIVEFRVKQRITELIRARAMNLLRGKNVKQRFISGHW